MNIKPFCIAFLIIILSIFMWCHIQFNSIFTPEQSKIKIVTSEKEHFMFHENYNSFPKDNYDYKIYQCVNGTEREVLCGEFETRDKINNTVVKNFNKYKYKNKEVRVYSDDSIYGKRILFKINDKFNYIFVDERHFVYDYFNKTYKEYYEYLIPFYRQLLKNINKDSLEFTKVMEFLIMVDDTESFDFILKNIKFIKDAECEKRYIDYIKNYPNSKKHKQEVIEGNL